MATLLVEKLSSKAGTTASKFQAYAAIRYSDSDPSRGYYIQKRQYLLFSPASGYAGTNGFQGTTFTCNWGSDFKVYGYANSSTGIYGDSGWVNVGWVAAGQTYSLTSQCGYEEKNASVTISTTVPKAITITYNANGGSGGPSTQVVWSGKSTTLSSVRPTRTDYNFLGWSTSRYATSASYSAGGTYSGTSSVTLYAVWSLGYQIPRITSARAYRCAANGAADDFGTYMKVTFNWATDEAVSSIRVGYALSDYGSYTYTRVYTSGTSGSESVVIGGNLNLDYNYSIIIEVSDSKGSTQHPVGALSAKYVLDFKSGGDGVAVGMAASEDGFHVGIDSTFHAQVNFDGDVYFNGVLYGEDDSDDSDVPISYDATSGITSITSARVECSGVLTCNNGFSCGNDEVSAAYIKGGARIHKDMIVYNGMSVYETAWFQNEITTSDERLKSDFVNLEKWNAFYDNLEPCAFKMKTDDSDRYHIGFKAQQVEQALLDSGLTTQDFSGFASRKYNANHEYDGTTLNAIAHEEAGIKDGDDEYGLGYTEFIALNTYNIQKLKLENKELKSKLSDLESQFEEIKSLLS